MAAECALDSYARVAQPRSRTVLPRHRTADSRGARAALAAAEDARSSQHRQELWTQARKDARRIARESAPYALPLASLILAGVSYSLGDSAEAVVQLERTIQGFEATDVELYAAVSKQLLGKVVGGDKGKTLIADADAWMLGQGIRNPSRWVRMMGPGFGSRA